MPEPRDFNKLKEEHKLLIVSLLARYAYPSEVVAALKELDVTVSPQQVSFYDPTTAAGAQRLPEERKADFWRIRAEHDAEIFKKIPASNRDYRLMRLDRIISHPTIGLGKNGLKALEQAAKEMGRMYERAEEASDVENEIKELLAQLAKAKT